MGHMARREAQELKPLCDLASKFQYLLPTLDSHSLRQKGLRQKDCIKQR